MSFFSESIDDFTTNLEIKNGVKISIYEPAPSFGGLYVGFDFTEE